MTAPAAAPPSRSRASSVGYNLGAIALTMVLLGLALAYALDAAGRPGREAANSADGDTSYVRTLGGRDLDIPAHLFRYAEQRVEGFAKQIDLRLDLPLGRNGAAHTVDVTLLPRSAARPSAGLLDGVYVHMFEPGELAGPHGLIGKQLRASGGYAGETVWFDPIGAKPFVTKCSTPLAPGGDLRCLRTVHLGPGIAAVYSFGFELLDNWRDFDAQLAPWLDRIGALR